MKIRPVAAEMFRADGRTYMTKLTVPVRNLANAPNSIHTCGTGLIKNNLKRTASNLH